MKIKVGDFVELKRQITQVDVEKFADLSGDYNPVHFDKEYAAQTIFKKPIAHGILSASFISYLLAEKLPGNGTIYLSQNLKFLKPIYINDNIHVRLEVIETYIEKKQALIKTQVLNEEGKPFIDGEALVMNEGIC